MKIKSTLKGLLLSVVGLSFLAGCSITDPREDFKIHVTMPPTGAVIGGQVLDTQGRLITTPLTLTIGGQDAAHVVDLMNERLTTLTTSTGFVVMAVNDTIPVEADDPIRFTVTVEGDGYFHATKLVTVTQSSGTTFSIRLLKEDLSDLPDGLSGDRENAALSGGATTSDVSLDTPPHPTSGTTNSMDIAAGSRFFDENGNPLTGPVTLNFVVGDLRSDTLGRADEFFPGGRDNLAVDDSTNIFPILFINLVGVDASGRALDRIDPPPSFTMQIPEGTWNPREERNYQAGDLVQMLDRVGDGTFDVLIEAVATGPDGSGNLTATFTLPAGAIAEMRRKSEQAIISSPDRNGNGGYVVGGVLRRFSADYYFNWAEASGRQFRIRVRSAGLDPREQTFDVDFRHVQSALIPANRVNPFLAIAGDYWLIYGDSIRGPWSMGNDQRINFHSPWLWPDPKNVTCHFYGKMPAGREPEEIRGSGIALAVANAADTTRWRSLPSAIQGGVITVDNLVEGQSYYFKGTYTHRGVTRTASTPWSRRIEANTDTLQFWYQLSSEEADDYERNK